MSFNSGTLAPSEQGIITKEGLPHPEVFDPAVEAHTCQVRTSAALQSYEKGIQVKELQRPRVLYHMPSTHYPKAWLLQAAPAQHTLPDGQVITLQAAEAELCGEALLQPGLLDPAFEGAGVFESAVISALAHQEPALRKVGASYLYIIFLVFADIRVRDVEPNNLRGRVTFKQCEGESGCQGAQDGTQRSFKA